MSRFTALAAAFFSLALAGAASAAPKNDGTGPVCEAGVGKAVCCKTFVANHCAYVSCCEQGNAAFFSAKHCSLCDTHKMEQAAHSKPASAACAVSAADCEVGNRAFFTAAAPYGTRGGKSACCASEKK